jgi:hypothetical protein
MVYHVPIVVGIKSWASFALMRFMENINRDFDIHNIKILRKRRGNHPYKS